MIENRFPHLKALVRDPKCNILMFHDGMGILPQLAAEGVLDNSVALFTFSWNVSAEGANYIRTQIERATKYYPEIERRVRLLLNSPAEFERVVGLIDRKLCKIFNNSSLINERYFSIGSTNAVYDAVYNARANIFKRHELTNLIESKIFIAYDWKFSDANIDLFKPVQIFKNVKGSDVQNYLHMARVGLMLSQEEGGCYASLEYLLCGMPVVSTPSIGGRDDFYNSCNSIISEPNPEAVRDAVKVALARLATGEFSPSAIRQDAIFRMSSHRRILCETINELLAGSGVAILEHEDLLQKIHSTNKLWKYRNMRLKTLHSAR
ncbi:glycosyltransferase family 4 protein [Pseudoxanthobacter sp. M-2]|uniref:glycosyltransferase n=1 Tax=Pseudoxanthobacter sp. M-2 TaxID=3078754 RepID=UPI0038FC39BB